MTMSEEKEKEYIMHELLGIDENRARELGEEVSKRLAEYMGDMRNRPIGDMDEEAAKVCELYERVLNMYEGKEKSYVSYQIDLMGTYMWMGILAASTFNMIAGTLNDATPPVHKDDDADD